MDEDDYETITHRVREVYPLVGRKENLKDCDVTISILNITDDYAPAEDDRIWVFDALLMARFRLQVQQASRETAQH